MLKLVLVSAVVVAIPVRPDRHAPPAPPRVASLADQVQGDWQLIGAVMGGQNQERKVNGTTALFKDNVLHLRELDRKNAETVSFTIDATRSPAAIDLVAANDPERRIEGIIKIEGNVLTLCFAHGGNGKRPLAFASPPETSVALLQFRRVSK